MQSRPYGSLHRGVHDPDLRLPGSLRDRIEPDQKHILQAHETLTDFPLSGSGLAGGVWFLLGLWFERHQIPLSWWTYSHRVQVGLELLCNQVHEFAAIYRVARFGVAGRGNLISQSMRDDHSSYKHAYLV